MSELVTVEALDNGAIWKVTFGDGKGNILDRATMGALAKVFTDAAAAQSLKAICLTGGGDNFSYGASIQEHRSLEVRSMLEGMRALVFAMLDCNVSVLAAVRGQCLGGGLEIVSLCHRTVAHRDAKLGQPEIALGVFPPVAALVMPDRIGRAHAEDLCLSGRSLSAEEALAIGLVGEVTDDDPVAVGIDWVRRHLIGHSASSLRLTVKALRASLADRLKSEWPGVESLYLETLMNTHDANEGIEAFLGKRPPRWENR